MAKTHILWIIFPCVIFELPTAVRTSSCPVTGVTAKCKDLNNSFPDTIPSGIVKIELDDDNVFSKITKADFKNYTNLEILKFDSAKLQQIAGDAFEMNKKLKEMSFFDNSLTSIEKGTFANLPELTKLDLSTNVLTALQDGAFANSPIKVLRLDQNSFPSFPKSGLSSLRATLEELYLSDCKNALGIIKSGDFSGFEKLKVLQLENCGITTIEANAFAELNLDGKKLMVGRNPFKCDCNLLPFIKYAKETLDPETLSQLECETPTKQKLALAADTLSCGSSNPALALSKMLSVISTLLTFLWVLSLGD